VNWISPNSTWLVTSRLNTTRHIQRVEPMHFGCVKLVEQHGSTRLSRRARHVERVVSRRDVTWRAKWNLGYRRWELAVGFSKLFAVWISYLQGVRGSGDCCIECCRTFESTAQWTVETFCCFSCLPAVEENAIVVIRLVFIVFAYRPTCICFFKWLARLYSHICRLLFLVVSHHDYTHSL